MMSSHFALPREDHLKKVYEIFAYLKKLHNSEMIFDPSDPVIDESLFERKESPFERKDWVTSEFGHDLKEEFTTKSPAPCGLATLMPITLVIQYSKISNRLLGVLEH